MGLLVPRYTINVLNAVPLRATASSNATAFSLIICMFWFPVLLLFGNPDDQSGGGERNDHPGQRSI
jgi:hypothetical protein